LIARLTGRPVEPVSLGSELELRAAMAKAEPEKKVRLAYLLYMTDGQTALSDLQNDRHPGLMPETFDAFAERTVKAPAQRNSMDHEQQR
jgi:uncharacterized protein YdhG (YjbR/CyaY superfamily)